MKGCKCFANVSKLHDLKTLDNRVNIKQSEVQTKRKQFNHPRLFIFLIDNKSSRKRLFRTSSTTLGPSVDPSRSSTVPLLRTLQSALRCTLQSLAPQHSRSWFGRPLQHPKHTVNSAQLYSSTHLKEKIQQVAQQDLDNSFGVPKNLRPDRPRMERVCGDSGSFQPLC
jgi:hypothetical protein